MLNIGISINKTLNGYKYDLRIKQNIKHIENIYFENIDLTDYTAILHVRQDIDTDLILELTTENGGIVIDSLLSKVSVILLQEQTASIKCGVYKYDLILIDVNEINTYYLTGDFIVDKTMAIPPSD
jgi:hypothetical protein